MARSTVNFALNFQNNKGKMRKKIKVCYVKIKAKPNSGIVSISYNILYFSVLYLKLNQWHYF